MPCSVASGTRSGIGSSLFVMMMQQRGFEKSLVRASRCRGLVERRQVHRLGLADELDPLVEKELHESGERERGPVYVGHRDLQRAREARRQNLELELVLAFVVELIDRVHVAKRILHTHRLGFGTVLEFLDQSVISVGPPVHDAQFTRFRVVEQHKVVLFVLHQNDRRLDAQLADAVRRPPR